MRFDTGRVIASSKLGPTTHAAACASLPSLSHCAPMTSGRLARSVESVPEDGAELGDAALPVVLDLFDGQWGGFDAVRSVPTVGEAAAEHALPECAP